MAVFIDMVGMQFGRLKVINYNHAERSNKGRKNLKHYWLCECNCKEQNKNTIVVNGKNLRNGHIKSCGCLRKEPREFKVEDLTGKKFGKLTAIEFDKKKYDDAYIQNGKHKYFWLCKCDCGNPELVSKNGYSLKVGKTNNCGCETGDKIGKKVHTASLLKNGSFGDFLLQEFGQTYIDRYWSKNNKLDLFKIAKCSKTKIKMICDKTDYHGEYITNPANFYNGQRCGFCGNQILHIEDSIGKKYPQSLLYWSNLNDTNPFENAPISKKKVWWKCENEAHDDYERCLQDTVHANFRCPNCVNERRESFLQEKVRLYLTKKLGFSVNHENNCTIVPKHPKNKKNMPFDNEVIDLKLIIEVHGEQHYSANSFNSWSSKSNCSYEEVLYKRKLYDRYKKYVAYRNGYEYLEIPYWTENDESYKTLIDNKIKEILSKKAVV